MESTTMNLTREIDLINVILDLTKEFSILLTVIQEGIIHAKKLYSELELDYQQKIDYNFYQSLNNKSLSNKFDNLKKSRYIVKDCEYAIEDITKCLKGIEQCKLIIRIEQINPMENIYQQSKDRISFVNNELIIMKKKYDTICELYNQNVDKYEQIINTHK